MVTRDKMDGRSIDLKGRPKLPWSAFSLADAKVRTLEGRRGRKKSSSISWGQDKTREEKREMKQSLRVYAAVLRLVRLLPSETRSYYARFARENFATYRDEDDAGAIANLFHRSYQHSCWILTKYGVDTEKADNLKQICKSLS